MKKKVKEEAKAKAATSVQISKSAKHAKVQRILSELQQCLPKFTVDFIRVQIVRSQRMKTGVHWTVSDKMLALSIFYHSHKASKIIGKLFAMPSKCSLQRALHKSNIAPGFTDSLFSALKMKVNAMSELDKQCVLVFDKMSLKTGITHNAQTDSIEGFEKLGSVGTTKCSKPCTCIYGTWTNFKMEAASWLFLNFRYRHTSSAENVSEKLHLQASRYRSQRLGDCL